jgi:hypothetical protein
MEVVMAKHVFFDVFGDPKKEALGVVTGYTTVFFLIGNAKW